MPNFCRFATTKISSKLTRLFLFNILLTFVALKLHNHWHCLYQQFVYFQEWLPNELSSILIEDFTSAKDLADHLHHLHRNDYEYLAYLRQKPSINDNILSRISNDFLIQAMNLRSWGVSDKDQLTEGTYKIALFNFGFSRNISLMLVKFS